MENQVFFRSIQDKYRLLESEGYSFFKDEKLSYAKRGLNKIPRCKFKNNGEVTTQFFSDIYDLNIVIPAFGDDEVLLECIKNVEVSVGINPLITIVNNGIPESMFREIESYECVKNIINNDENIGYGQGCDQGIKSIDSEFCILLNSDALVEPDSLRYLVDTLSDNVNISVAASICLNPYGTIQEIGRVIKADGHTLAISENLDKEGITPNSIVQVPYSSFVCVAIRISDYLSIGGFDQKFSPAYSEDVDLCIRLWQDGKAVVVNTNSKVNHAGGVASSKLVGLDEIKNRNIQYLKTKHNSLLSSLFENVDINSYPHEMNLLFGILFRKKLLIFANEELTISQLEDLVGIKENEWVLHSIFILTNRNFTNQLPFSSKGVNLINTHDSRESHHFLRNHIGYFDEVIISFDATADKSINMLFATQPMSTFKIRKLKV